MNKSITTIELGWTGSTGYCLYYGKSGLLLSKPNFTFNFDVSTNDVVNAGVTALLKQH